MELAVQDDNVFVTRAYFNQGSLLQRAKELNASWIRVNVLWAASNGSQATKTKRPSTPRYDFAGYDSIVTAARANGIKVHLTITTPAPAWATGNRKRGVYKPNSKYFAEFVTRVVTQYKGLVGRISLINEPNHIAWLSPLKDQGTLYRSLYRAGYKAAKRANSSVRVLFGETAPFARRSTTATAPLKFLRAVLGVNSKYQGTGTKLRADGFAHHPYDFEHKYNYKYPGGDNVTIATLSRLAKALDKLYARGLLKRSNGARLDWYLTEFGYMASGKYAISRERHAKYLVEAFRIAQAHPRVRQMLQYILVKPSGTGAYFDTSILGRNGEPTQPFNALKAWAARAANEGKIIRTGQQSPPITPPPGCGLPVCP